MRTPILAEVTHWQINEVPWCEGLETHNGKVYAILGYYYDEEETKHW